MSQNVVATVRRFRHAVTLLWLTAALFLHAGPPHGGRHRRDEGSETIEKAVLTAIGLGIALGLAAAIAGVVHKYQGQIH